MTKGLPSYLLVVFGCDFHTVFCFTQIIFFCEVSYFVFMYVQYIFSYIINQESDLPHSLQVRHTCPTQVKSTATQITLGAPGGSRLRHCTTSLKVTGLIHRWCHWNFSPT